MYGPYEPGHWSKVTELQPTFEFLETGRRYRVCATFTDFDGDLHVPGEEWTFLGSSFLPYDDGLSLFVSLDGSREWQIRMQWRPEAQGGVLDELTSYVVPA
jgi:uncharacterized protein DUF3601